MFSRNKKNKQQRIRQPELGSNLGSRPVFSYHANSARTDKSGGRKAASALWSAPEKPAVERRKPVKWFRRVPIVVGILLFAAFVVSNLLLSRDPEVITLTENENTKVFLRNHEAYVETARSIMASSFANTNKLTVDSGEIARDMQTAFPELEHVSVVLPFIGRQAEIYLQPAQPALLLKASDGGVYVVDTSGRALISTTQTPRIQKMGLVLVEDQSGLQLKLGDTILPRDNIAFITEVVGQLKAKKINISAMVLPRATNQLDVRIEGAPYIVKFNLRGDAREEAGAFLAVKQHLEREGKTPVSHIDVRVDNKAYYR